ncbi:MAG: hypothetical protein HC880_04110 [Bacteroidia bacterium]|nr:hypothetical protein [Bacteroidia bacterium]
MSIQRNIQLIAGEFKVQDKQRSWIKRLTGMGTQDTPPDIQLTVAVYGTFWLGTVRIVY